MPSTRLLTIPLSALLLAGALALPAEAVAAKSYKSCAALQQDYPHGVGRSGATDKTSGKKVTSFTVSTKVYNLNNGPRAGAQYDLDRDDDGIACEKA